ncbi:hypothetical protein EDB89DRAFT_2250342 [Lactarius sanguifluus]|nr:hypothetical protein EDB89DRAFT_2250342 [Lactarius sanguifluus]
MRRERWGRRGRRCDAVESKMAAEPHNAGPKTERPKTRVISGADSEPELTTTQRRTLDLVKKQMLCARSSIKQTQRPQQVTEPITPVLADVTSGPLPMLLKDLPFFAPLRASLRWQHYCQAEGFTGTGAGVCSGFPISQVDDETPTYSWLSRPQTRWRVSMLGHGITHTSCKLQQCFLFSLLLTPLPQGFGTHCFVGVASTHTAAPVARDELSSPGDHLKHQHTVVPIAQPATCHHTHPGPILASFVERDDGTTVEYWSKYAGVGIVSSHVMYHTHVPVLVLAEVRDEGALHRTGQDEPSRKAMKNTWELGAA